jgi:tetratricopeptide (TPR) repeat protein
MTPNNLSPKTFLAMRQLLLRGLLLLTAVATAIDSAGQSNQSLATQAAQLCQAQSLDEAIVMSQAALKDPKESLMAYTWYVYGFVCKEIYKTRESNLRSSTMRKEAISAFLEAENKQATSEISTVAPLRYLITTLHNDALMCANDFQIINEMEPDSLFEQYRVLAERTALHTKEQIKDSEIQFLKTKGQRYFELWNNDPAFDYCVDMAIKSYSTALEKAPVDCISVYNIGVAYYDQAVFQAQIEGLNLTEMTRVDIARSYFSKAIELCPEDAMIQAAFKLTNTPAHTEQVTQKKLSLKRNR